MPIVEGGRHPGGPNKFLMEVLVVPIKALPVERLRRSVASDMVNHFGFDYWKVLTWMQRNDVFGNWEADEFDRRPVDLDELADCYISHTYY